MHMLIKKPAWLGKSSKGHNVKSRPADGEEGGDAGESVPAKEYRLTDILLTKRQFEFFLGKGSWDRHYDNGEKPPKWLEEGYRRIPLTENYIDSEATLVFGVSARTIELTEAVKFKNNVIVISKADAPTLSTTLQAPFPRKLESLDLELFYDKEIAVELKFGDVEEEEQDPAQKQLPMETADDDDAAGEDKPNRRKEPETDESRTH